MTKKPKHKIITTITRARFKEIHNWVLAGRLPDELMQYADVHPDEVPKKTLTKLRQADALMRFYQNNDKIIEHLLVSRWRILTIRKIGDEELAEMVLTR